MLAVVRGETDLEQALKRQVAELQAEIEALKLYRALAAADPLTGLPNRRAVEQRLAEELSRARRARSSVAIVVLDVDGFHDINAKQGYVAGDRLLQTLSQTLLGLVRDYDVVGRLGGDRFAVILPAVDAAGADRFVERFREASWLTGVSAGRAVSSADSVAETLMQDAIADLVASRRAAAAARADAPLPLDTAVPVDVVDAALESLEGLLARPTE